MLIVSQFYFRTIKSFALPVYLVSIVALIVVYLAGEAIRGSVRWIDFGIFRFQPSEVAKVGSILTLALFFTKRSAAKVTNLIASLLLISPAFLLILVEPDIGSAAAILAIWLTVAFAAGMKKDHILALFLLAILTATISFEILAPYQKQRIETFVDPSKDPLGSGYNILQSKIAVGAGQLFGRGLGRGSQSQLNFLPESESDFIFASIAEQLGFVGAGLVIIIFVILIRRITKVLNSTDRFGQLTTVGILGLFIYQFTVNVGMNMGIIPVTGITLPLVSYGGSSLVANLLLLGILFAVKKPNYNLEA